MTAVYRSESSRCPFCRRRFPHALVKRMITVGAEEQLTYANALNANNYGVEALLTCARLCALELGELASLLPHLDDPNEQLDEALRQLLLSRHEALTDAHATSSERDAVRALEQQLQQSAAALARKEAELKALKMRAIKQRMAASGNLPTGLS